MEPNRRSHEDTLKFCHIFLMIHRRRRSDGCDVVSFTWYLKEGLDYDAFALQDATLLCRTRMCLPPQEKDSAQLSCCRMLVFCLLLLSLVCRTHNKSHSELLGLCSQLPVLRVGHSISNGEACLSVILNDYLIPLTADRNVLCSMSDHDGSEQEVIFAPVTSSGISCTTSLVEFTPFIPGPNGVSRFGSGKIAQQKEKGLYTLSQSLMNTPCTTFSGMVGLYPIILPKSLVPGVLAGSGHVETVDDMILSQATDEPLPGLKLVIISSSAPGLNSDLIDSEYLQNFVPRGVRLLSPGMSLKQVVCRYEVIKAQCAVLDNPHSRNMDEESAGFFFCSCFSVPSLIFCLLRMR